MSKIEKKYISGVLLLLLSACTETPSNNSANSNDVVQNTEETNYFSVQHAEPTFDGTPSFEMDSIVINIEYWHYCIPKVRCNDEQFDDVVNDINRWISSVTEFDEYGIDLLQAKASDDDLKKWCENSCAGMWFTYEIHSNYLLLTIKKIERSAFAEEITFSALFDLSTGDQIQQHEVPFTALFSEKGFFDFLFAINWRDTMIQDYQGEAKAMLVSEGFSETMQEKGNDKIVRKGMTEEEIILESAMLDAKSAELDINGYKITDSSLVFTHKGGGRSWTYRCYYPYCEAEVKKDELKPYLSKLGKKLILEKLDSEIEKELLINELLQGYETKFTKIEKEGKTIMLAINYQNPDSVWGYVYNDSAKCESLSGTYRDNIFYLKSANNGEFSLKND